MHVYGSTDLWELMDNAEAPFLGYGVVSHHLLRLIQVLRLLISFECFLHGFVRAKWPWPLTLRFRLSSDPRPPPNHRPLPLHTPILSAIRFVHALQLARSIVPHVRHVCLLNLFYKDFLGWLIRM